MLAHSFLNESSSKLLVTKTDIKACTSLISGWIRLLTLELLALEWRKFYTFELEYLWGQLASLDQILCVASWGVGWMDELRVLHPFNSISVISRWWKGEHERLCAMKRCLGSRRISPPAGPHFFCFVNLNSLISSPEPLGSLVSL